MSISLKTELIVAGVVALLAGAVIVEREVEHRGALKVLTQQADSIAVLRKHESDSSTAVQLQAIHAAHDSAVVALVKVKAAKTQQAHTDSLAREASNERDQAIRLLADSLAGLQALRAEVTRLVLSGRADSIAAALQHQADQRAIVALLVSHTADSTALERGIAATNASSARAVAAEKEIGLLKQSMPSPTAGWLKTGLWLAAGYGACKLTRC